MLRETSLPRESRSLPLQVGTDQAVLSGDVVSGRSTRFLWTGSGFAALMLMGVSACAILPLAPQTSAKSSWLVPINPSNAFRSGVAFNPSVPALQGVRAPTTNLDPAARHKNKQLKQRQSVSGPRMSAAVETSQGTATNDQAQAIASLNNDITEALRFDHVSPEEMQKNWDKYIHGERNFDGGNWDIFTDSFETDFRANNDPSALRLLSAVLPSWDTQIKELRLNQRVLEEMRTFVATLRLSKVLVSDVPTVSTKMGVDPISKDEVIESRWSVNLEMKRLSAPAWIQAPGDPQDPLVVAASRTVNAAWKKSELWTGVSDDEEHLVHTINVQAVSRFYPNAEGKIYRHSMDDLTLLVDGEGVDSSKLEKFLDLLVALPVPDLKPPVAWCWPDCKVDWEDDEEARMEILMEKENMQDVHM